MKRVLPVLLLLLPLSAFASGPFTSLHPEEHEPDAVQKGSPDPYNGLISEVQEQLIALGFDPGPVNGDWNTKTQAALAQFQLSRILPAGGQLDEQTLSELGVQRQDLSAAAGN
jgi:peptidoglycan hydrolase-like protein with peptidoglycan-binding domain